MKAVIWHGIGDIGVGGVPEPQAQEPIDAVIRSTENAICGTDLHFIRGTVSGKPAGTILGHQGVGAVDQNQSCLDMARKPGAETINFDQEDPVDTIKRLIGGAGVDWVIDAVGVDSDRSHSGPALAKERQSGEIEQAEQVRQGSALLLRQATSLETIRHLVWREF